MSDTLRFTSFDQVKTGLLWQSRRLKEIDGYERLWANVPRQAPAEFDQAIRQGSTWVQFSPYARVTSFWTDSLFGGEIVGVPDQVVDVFARAARHRSVGGHGVIVDEGGGRLRAVPAQNWHPVMDPRDGEHRIGHVLGWPWVAEPNVNSAGDTPDRLDVALFAVDGGVNLRQTWELGGSQLGQLLEERPAGIQGIEVWGDGVSDYRDLVSIFTEIEYRWNRFKRILDWHSDPTLQGPMLYEQLRVKSADQREALQAEQLEPVADARFSSVSGAFLAREAGDPEFSYLDFNAKHAETVSMLNWLLDQATISSSVPASALGASLDMAAQGGGNVDRQSGVSRERQMYSAVAKLRNLRRELEPALQRLSGLQDIDWPLQLFSSWSEMTSPVLSLVAAGLIDQPAAAELLGVTYSGRPAPTSGQ